MNIYQLDLNLLLILKQLLEEKHVSNTALTLNMNQSSVSRALKKMRIFFDDELLVRTHYGYELTSKAETIKLDLNSVIASLERLVHKQAFEPSNLQSTVKFYGLEPQINALLPKVIARIRNEAPDLIVSIDTTPKRHFEELIAGDVHFALSSHEPPISEQNIYRMLLANRSFRLLMSKDHPLANQNLTPEKLREFQFGQISLQGEKSLSLENKYRELGLTNNQRKLRAPVQISNFNSAPAIAASTDIIFHLPTPFAEAACIGQNLIAREVPEELQLAYAHVYLYWHKRFHDDPMCEWIRSLFKNLYENQGTIA